MLVKLKDISTRLSSGDSIKSSSVKENGIFPVFGGNGIRGYTDSYNFNGECVLIGRQGEQCGNIHYFKGKAFITEHAIVLCTKTDVDTRYIACLLSLIDLRRFSSQSAQPGISVDTIKNITIDILNSKSQTNVGHILSLIEQQLERNNAIVKRLQVLAHTPFDYFSKNNTKSNFVVFNDILVEKDKSKIQVSDVQDTSGFIPFFTSGETILYTNQKLETGFNIFLSTGGNAKVQAYYGDSSYSTDTWCITAKNNLQFYLYGFLKHIESQMDKLYFHGTGLKHLQKPIFLKSIITIPNENLLIKYNTIVEPIYYQISKIEQSTIQLQCLKNKLLPLLINQQLI